MTKKERELVEKLRREMPEFSGSKAEIEKQIAMYIYLELGRTKVFDEHFYLADKETQNKIIKLNARIKTSRNSLIKNRKVTCLKIANLYKILLRDFKIRCITARLHPQSTHYYNAIKFSDGSLIVADLQKDMSNIQARCKTEFFGHEYKQDKIVTEGLTEEEIFKLHKACGYVNKKEDYMDEKIEILAARLRGLPPDQLLDELLRDKDVNKLQEDIGYIEFFKYYTKLIKKVAPMYDNKEIKYLNCYRRKDVGKRKTEKDYLMCIYAECNNELSIYLFNQAEKCFQKVDLETMENLERQGLILGKSQDEKGLIRLREYMSKIIVDRYKKKYTNNNYDRDDN